MKVVIVGSQGFIGKELSRVLRAKNIDVIEIDMVPSDNPNCIVADIRSKEIEAAIPPNVDAVIHLAAISRDVDCKADPRLAYDVNILGTINLFQAAQHRGAGQFIFASSEWVYGQTHGHAAQTEDQIIDMAMIRSEYALSKIAGEQILRLAHLQGQCPVTILRFGIIYGPRPGNWSAVESLFHAVRTQETVTVGSLATARRFIHVSDIANGIYSAMGRDGYEVFNLSGDKLITLRDIIEQSVEIWDRRPEVLETDPRNANVRNPENRKARTELGWAPMLDLKGGLSTLMEVSVAAGD